jgi:hypothetical protein
VPTMIVRPVSTVWTRLLSFVLSLAVVLFTVAPALATSIQTDLWVYQYGDTVNVSGDGFGATEAVEIVTTDPYGGEVDRGTAQSDDAGYFNYSFVLLSDVPGIYDVVATGSVSALSASTQFDPPPGAPGNVRFTDRRWAVGGDLLLEWSNVSGADCYYIYRARTPPAGSSLPASPVAGTSCTTVPSGVLAIVAAPATSFTDSNVDQGHQYTYAVTSVRTTSNNSNNNGESTSFSNIVATASLATAPATASFGNVALGASAGQLFTVTNNGPDQVTFRSIIKSGTDPASFAVSGVPAANTTYATGASFTFTVTFAPLVLGARSATIEINASETNQGNQNFFNVRLVPVSGVGVSADSTAPTGSVNIQNGAAATNLTGVNLRLQATDAVGVTGYRIANGSDCSAASYVSVASTTSLDLNPGPSLTLSAGDGVKTVCAQFRDAAGNESATATDTIVLDQAAPLITATAKKADLTTYVAGTWTNQSVTVSFSCSDGSGSGLLTNTTASDGGTLSADTSTGSFTSLGSHCVDNAGNPATTSVFGPIMIDKTAPVISYDGQTPAANDNVWNNSAVTLDWSCSDALSGAVSASDSHTLSGEGANQSSTGDCYDLAGNHNSDLQSGINIDLTAPVIAFVSRVPVANPFGWANADVLVTWSCNDPLSGVVNATVTWLVTTQGLNQSSTGDCYDLAGNYNSNIQSGLSIDKVAPGIGYSGQIPAANSYGWNRTSVVLSWNCSDALSGVVSASDSHTVSSEGAGQSATGDCYDKAGNHNSQSHSGINIDLTAPDAPAWSGGPADGGTYYFGFIPAAPTCSSADALSGLVDCVVTGWSSAIGSHTMTATATDKAGNTTSVTRTYSVNTWSLYGFYQPVDMNGTYNVVKGGSTVPLKFEIFAGSTELTLASYVASFIQTKVQCDGSLPTDEIELVTTGGTSLRYDSTGGQFIQNWQTPKSPGQCYRVTVVTQDASTLIAFFKLK